MADEDGFPHKSNKSHWTDKLQRRYQSADASVILNSLVWVPQAVIIDAMFMINTRPLRRTTTIAEYGKLLFNQYALEYFRMGASEVHLVFDNPTIQAFNPKQLDITTVKYHTNTNITILKSIRQFPKEDGMSSWNVLLVREL